MVRRRRLLERYALLWLFSAVVILGLAVWRGALEQVAHAVGIYSPPNALFFIAMGFILVLLLHFSAAVSRLADQSKVLAQRQAIVEQQLRELERQQVAAGRRGSGLRRTPRASRRARSRARRASFATLAFAAGGRQRRGRGQRDPATPR